MLDMHFKPVKIFLLIGALSTISSCGLSSQPPLSSELKTACTATEVEGFFSDNADNDVLRDRAKLQSFLSEFEVCRHSFVFDRIFTYSRGEPVIEKNLVDINTRLSQQILTGCVDWRVNSIPPLSGQMCFEQ